MPLKLLAAIGVRRVTVPRMLPAAAIMGMTRALEAMNGVIANRRTRRSPRPRRRHRGHHEADGLRQYARTRAAATSTEALEGNMERAITSAANLKFLSYRGPFD